MDGEEMDRLTAGMKTKAEKVRALHQAGVSTADIGRYIGIRYQHVYNVLLRAGLVSKGGQSAEEPTEAGEISVLALRKDGSLQLPPHLMEKYGFAAGEPLFCRETADGITLMSREAALAHVREAARARMPEQAALIEALLKS